MAVTERLQMLLTANGSQAIAEFQKTGAAAQKSLASVDTGTAKLSQNLVRVGAGMAALGGVMLVGLYKAAQAAEEENLAIEKLNNSIANSPELAGASADAFLDQAAALQDVTAFADDATISAQAMLGTFHLTQDEILGLTPLVADLASKFDLDLSRASILVGKAMDGNIGTLQRMGVRIDSTAYAADRYDAVMTALRENAGGFAEQEGATFSGRMEILKNNMGDIAEGIGVGAVEAFESLLGPVEAVSDAFTSLSPGTQSAVGKVAAFGAAGLIAVGSASMLAGWLIKLRTAYQMMVPAAAAAEAATAGVGAASLAAKGAMGATAVAAVALAAVWANSMTDLEVDWDIAELLSGNAEALRLSGEQFQWLTETAGSTGEALDHFRRLAETNVEAATAFGAAWIDAGGPAAEIGEILWEAGEAAERAALGLDDSSTSAEELAARYDQLSESIDNYLNRIQGTEEAAAAEAEAQQALFEALARNGSTFDVNTAAGRENIGMRNSWVDAVAAQVQAAIEQGQVTGRVGRAQGQANAAIRAGIGDLRRMRDAGLITESQFRDLKRSIENIPHNIEGTVTIHGIETAISQMQRLYQAAQDAAAAISQTGGSLAGGGTYGNAHGGFVREGESTMVHNGERVSVEHGRAVVTPASAVNATSGSKSRARRPRRAAPMPVYLVGSV